MFPKLISIGTFFLPTYGVLTAVAFLLALWVTVRLGRRTGLNSDRLTNLAVYCALAGMLGAKLAMFAFDWRYYSEHPGEIELAPMSKFPVLRDLCVDRARMFRALSKVRAWIPADGYYDQGPGPRLSQAAQEAMYPLSECMSCGCCLDACPQYLKIELDRMDGESEEAFENRKNEAYDRGFIGAHAISQAILFNLNPTGKNNANERLDALMEEGGIQDCGNAQNCVAVCPKKIPLTTSIGRAGRATTVRMLQKWFGA